MNVTTVLTFLLAMVLFVGGLLLMGYAFDTPGLELIMFSAGLITLFIASAVPVLLWRAEHRRSQQ
ncbi:hypothetical protein [Agrococcus sp. Ld7]|uniref:hypothetical protein n=1 Tax=Agrococcus sp. Ld7 TaxID=649148 RepID=UPI00386717A6